MTSHSNRRLAAAVMLHARTAELLGVDFLPVAALRRIDTGGPSARPRAPRLAVSEHAAALESLRLRHETECPHCTRATAHTRLVFGDGDPDADLMFIGEAPGAEEDRQGIPFVGRSGRKLNEMIAAMGLRREDVYIANVLKARPPNNATPTPEEAARCGPYLAEQVAIIRPKVIVSLGKPAANFLLSNTDSMSSLRGRWHEYRGVPLMPTFHPAYLLRAYTPENRKKVWSDLQQAVARLKDLGVVIGNAPEPA